MSDDEADPELLELLRQSLGMGKPQSEEILPDTGVLKDAEYVYANAIDVSIDMWGTKGAAALIHKSMQERTYSTESWSQHELHPTREDGFSDIDIVNFIFTMDLLNFSFWSQNPENDRFQVEYQERRWAGYKSLLACLRRALDEGIPVTTPSFWLEDNTPNEMFEHAFRSATNEDMPLLQDRVAMLRHAGEELSESFGEPDQGGDRADQDASPHQSLYMEDAGEHALGSTASSAQTGNPVLHDQKIAEYLQASHASEEVTAGPNEGARQMACGQGEEAMAESLPANEALPLKASAAAPDRSIVRLIEMANGSAGKLVNLLVKHFPAFRDETRFDGRKVRFLKRAQIFVADLWAAMNGKGYGAFGDIDHLTMFADYRVPQMLHSLGVLVYSPPLENAIRTQQELPAGHSWEVQLRGCSIWAVELIRREILRQEPGATVNAVLIDFFLYDLAKEREAAGAEERE